MARYFQCLTTVTGFPYHHYVGYAGAELP